MCHFKSWLRSFCSLDFGTNPLISTLLIAFYFFFYLFINPNFCLGRLFGFSTYRVRTFGLPLGLLEAHAWCLSLPNVGLWGIYQLFLSSSSLLYYQNLVLIWSVLIVFKFHALVHAYDQHICSDILLLIFLYEILCSAILVNVSVIDYWTIFF